MARPKKTGLDYFPHDVDASNDEKIEAMESLYGAHGYTFYFKLAERIYRAGGEILVDEVTRGTLVKKCLTTPEVWDKMIETALHVGLFDKNIFTEKKILTSSGIKKRCKEVFAERRRKAKWKKDKELGNVVSDGENTGARPEGAGFSFRERKGKKRKGKHDLTPLPPAGGLWEIFEIAREAYPGIRLGAGQEWANFEKKFGKRKDEILPLLLPAIRKYKAFTEKKARADSQPPKWANFSTWINQERWTAEYPGEAEAAAPTGQPLAPGLEARQAQEAKEAADWEALPDDEKQRILADSARVTAQVAAGRGSR